MQVLVQRQIKRVNLCELMSKGSVAINHESYLQLSGNLL